MDKLTYPYFVEFVGVPGSGKSTLSHHVAKQLGEDGLPFKSPIYKINDDSTLFARLFYKLFYSANNLLVNKGYVDKYIEYIGDANVNLKLLINWLFVSGVSANYSKKKVITLYDQGLIQALWSFMLSESNRTIDFFQNLFLNNYPGRKGLIICVNANDKIVKHRLSQRITNKSRVGIDKNDKYNVDEALKSYMKVIRTVDSLIKSRSNMNKMILVNDKETDLEKNVINIVDKIKANICVRER